MLGLGKTMEATEADGPLISRIKKWWISHDFAHMKHMALSENV